jgi:hypothetical protein
MRRTIKIGLLLVAGTVSTLTGGTPTVQSHFIIDPVVNFALTAGVVTFNIDNIPLGQSGQDVKTTGYSFATNITGPQKITVKLDTEMPTGTKLQLLATAPNGATAIPVQLAMTPVDCVRDISPANQVNIQLQYSFLAEIGASVGSFTKTVTFTVISQ